MSLKLGVLGTRYAHARDFIPLFKAHPLVGEVVLCDQDPDLLELSCRQYGIPATAPSLEDMCASDDIDAIALFTPAWLHAPQAIQALRAGKHVYSALPAGTTVEEITELVQTVEQTGKIYMTAETSYHYPAAIYCRDKIRKGEMGRIVYGEGEYYHDWSFGLYDVAKSSGGENWKVKAGRPPMSFPTHSTSFMISVTGAYMTHVSCQGFKDSHEDGLYGEDANIYGNPFSNQTALFKMSDGSMCRTNEFRRIGHRGTIRMTLFGTEGSFEWNAAGSAWVTKKSIERLDDLLECGTGPDSQQSASGFTGVSPLHDVGRLPEEFKGMPNGHRGSHQFLIDDFVKACLHNTLPPNHVWNSARYVIPGIIAHESAMKGGELLEIPDLGGPPAGYPQK